MGYKIYAWFLLFIGFLATAGSIVDRASTDDPYGFIGGVFFMATGYLILRLTWKVEEAEGKFLPPL